MDTFAGFLMLYTRKPLKTVELMVIMRKENEQEASLV